MKDGQRLGIRRWATTPMEFPLHELALRNCADYIQPEHDHSSGGRGYPCKGELSVGEMQEMRKTITWQGLKSDGMKKDVFSQCSI